MESPLLDKSLDFATETVLFFEEYSKSKKDTTIARQLLRSATSIGANINEAVYGNSKADFIAKLQISLKEANETGYWLELLYKTGYLTETQYKSLDSACTSIRVMLISSINTAKGNQEKSKED